MPPSLTTLLPRGVEPSLHARLARMPVHGDPVRQRAALVQLRAATGGKAWAKADGWGDERIDVADWVGISTGTGAGAGLALRLEVREGGGEGGRR